ncbi:high frequency lysogenization protein HflD [Colwellia ponticola]|uniref:High frequency lysogenization protein HflD homolog n=1 Tax=Colwellia ponticola TaxID=2304625 RepID=A0A8H2JJX4_9GAMM|nr:high frequency lysogenization protein HflD [Colwellia ponticola]TMM41933.1 high frequency lysogenization protein HflD [Colwellia ponticola]
MKEITITLAAICQVAYQVQHVSRTGHITDDDFSILLQSIIETSPVNTLAVYGGQLDNIKKGLEVLVNHLGGEEVNTSGNSKDNKDPELTRYIMSLINLERRLTKQPQLLDALGERINATKRQLEHYSLTSDTLTASFASIYSDIISPLGHKIQVTGEPTILKQSINQYKIRALLLAGIRSAVLWRQVGGKRRQILFNRKKIVETAKALLNTVQ